LWAREHYKSTIITFAKTIQDILASHGDNPLPIWGGREVTVGIFSFNRPGAKKFLEFIRNELSSNEQLKYLFPDILYDNPAKEASKWSLDDGIIVKRKKNQREATVEAWGLIDSMPTGSHYLLRVYDDVITERYARSPDMIKKSIESWELSLNLGARWGFERYIGTRYHFNDAYKEIMRRKSVIPRIYPATDDGRIEGNPVYLTGKELRQKRRDQGPYVFACQMMQNPAADETQGFSIDWLRYYKTHNEGLGMNIYILIDPANEKKRTSDYTALFVIGLAPDKNYYVLEMYRDRLNLTQRTELLFRTHRKWADVGVKGVGYEKYGKDSDISHIESVMESDNYRFEITSVGGSMAKPDRIKRLTPLFEQGLVYLPESCNRTNYEGVTEDLVTAFIEEEYKAFPVPLHDDMLDALSRIFDIDTKFPMHEKKQPEPERNLQQNGWMA